MPRASAQRCDIGSGTRDNCRLCRAVTDLRGVNTKEVGIEPVAAPRVVLDHVVRVQLDIERLEEFSFENFAESRDPLAEPLTIDVETPAQHIRRHEAEVLFLT